MTVGSGTILMLHIPLYGQVTQYNSNLITLTDDLTERWFSWTYTHKNNKNIKQTIAPKCWRTKEIKENRMRYMECLIGSLKMISACTRLNTDFNLWHCIRFHNNETTHIQFISHRNTQNILHYSSFNVPFRWLWQDIWSIDADATNIVYTHSHI